MTAVFASEARLLSTEVTLTAIRVGTKQMTLAVYRQLPELYVPFEELGSDGPGQLWGWVNVCPDGDRCEFTRKPHRHTIIQRQDLLGRGVAAPVRDYADRALLKGHIPTNYAHWSKADLEEHLDYLQGQELLWQVVVHKLPQLYIAI